MATKKPEDILENPQGIDAKDAEIEKLKAELEKAKSRAAYVGPKAEQRRIQQLAVEAAEENEDPWTIFVEVRVPKRPATEDPWYWININNRTVQIPANDKVQEMKLPFALALLDMLAAEDKTQDYIDEEMRTDHQLGGSDEK